MIDTIVRGSTSDISFPKPDLDIVNMWVTFAQGEEKLNLDLTAFTEEDGVYTHLLTQEETLQLDEGLCEIQVKFFTADGNAPITYPISHIRVGKALKPEVIGDVESESK